MTPPSGSGLNLRAPFPFGFEAAQREQDQDDDRGGECKWCGRPIAPPRDYCEGGLCRTGNTIPPLPR